MIGQQNKLATKECVILKEAKRLLMQNYELAWQSEVNVKPKLRYYRELRGSFETANHLKCNLTKKKRALLSQLSCGVLPLRVETGRYKLNIMRKQGV